MRGCPLGNGGGMSGAWTRNAGTWGSPSWRGLGCPFSADGKCAKQSLAFPVGETPTLEGLAIHQESSLGRTVVT